MLHFYFLTLQLGYIWRSGCFDISDLSADQYHMASVRCWTFNRRHTQCEQETRH